MVTDKELRQLIERARELGAGIGFLERTDAEGRALVESVQVFNVAEIGPHPMSPISAAERLREFLSTTVDGIKTPDPRTGFYYVTLKRDDGQYRRLRGPFINDHARALAAVDESRQRTIALDPRAHWYSFGTSRWETDQGPGILDKLDNPAHDDSPNEYEARQERRRGGLNNAADNAKMESNRRFTRAHASIEGIPPGQPILVGHHSERGHRAALKRHDTNMRKAFAAGKRADELARRAEAVGTGGVSSDDPQAIVQLRSQLADLKAQHERDKTLATLWRKAGRPAADDKKAWETLARTLGVKLTELGDARLATARDRRGPVPSYKLSYNTANMRRIEKRIDALSRLSKERARAELSGDTNRMIECKGYTVTVNLQLNRVQLHFAKKPPKPVRVILKRGGWVCAPSQNYAWQRKWNESVVLYVTQSPFRDELEKAIVDTAE